MTPGKIRPELVRTEKIHVLSAVPSQGAKEAALQGWQGLPKGAGFEHFLAGPGSTDQPLLPSVRVLHLVGRLRQDNLGIVFEAGQDLGRLLASAGMLNLRLQGRRDGSESNQESVLLSAADVSRLFPNLTVFILQGLPGRQDKRRFDSDRDQAALMRRYAAELFAMGVAAVIVIPAVESTLGPKVIEPLAAAIGPQPKRGFQPLLDAVGAIQGIIAGSMHAPGLTEAPANWESAFDVCLYGIDDWNGQMSRVDKPSVAAPRSKPLHAGILPGQACRLTHSFSHAIMASTTR